MAIWSVVAESTPGVWALALIEGLCLIAILAVSTMTKNMVSSLMIPSVAPGGSSSSTS